ncbi:MAG: tetratricopeptide repeat protein [Proteobacteria bacterium]|nr:tetratricopeptide repeat protein [Pseudomonadota bacterium]
MTQSTLSRVGYHGEGISVLGLGAHITFREQNMPRRASEHPQRQSSKRAGRKRSMRPLPPELEAARARPDDDEAWEQAEAWVERTQRPDDVSRLYRNVLGGELPSELASVVGQRAVRFHEAWYGGDSKKLPELLARVVELDPAADWAFQRLTMSHTAAERWTDLLELYDRVVESSAETSRRMQLLDEAAHIAKDFAGQPDRAIGYLEQLFRLDPSNAKLASSLERLLERRERWSELIVLWQARAEVLGGAEIHKANVRVATCYLDKLSDYTSALDTVRVLMRDEPQHPAVDRVLEAILAAGSAPADTRLAALQILRERYVGRGSAGDVVRVLEAGASFLRGEQRTAALSELTELLITVGQEARALEHQAALLVIDPSELVQAKLGALAERTGRHERYAEALVAAADAVDDRAHAVALIMQAAQVREDQLGDLAGAIELYKRVLDAGAVPAATLAAARRLNELLSTAEREQERLGVLERLAKLEPEPSERNQVLGQIARLADKLGDSERALAAWNRRLQGDSTDLEPLDALIESHTQARDWPKVVELLGMRVAAPVSAQQRRQDLMEIARIFSEELEQLDDAIETWRELQRTFGEDAKNVAALSRLLRAAERWQELTELLARAAAHETTRFTELQAELGSAYRDHLGEPQRATECFRSALEADPRHHESRAGLRSLLAVDACKAEAADALARAFAVTDEWQNTLAILDVRLEVADSPASKAALLREARSLHEDRGSDPGAALDCMRRAFALDPRNEALEAEVERLASSTGNWSLAAAAYRGALERAEPQSARLAHLRFREGSILELRLEQPEAALEAYEVAAGVAPERVDVSLSLVRVASGLGRWAVASRAIVCSARDLGRIEPSLWEEVEAGAARASAWDALAEAMARAIADAAGLPASLARELEAAVARWQRQRRDDPEAAEAALLRAVGHEPTHIETLDMLVELQRRASGRPLVETLLRLAELTPDNLDALHEAADVAENTIGDRDLAVSILRRLFERCAKLLKRGGEASGARQVEPTALWAVQRLVVLTRQPREYASTVDLLLRAASMPFELSVRQQFRHEAAELYAQELEDPTRAIDLYRQILDVDPVDQKAVKKLGDIFLAQDRLPDLLLLRRRELGLDLEQERRLQLRLDVAHIMGVLEDRGGRVESLRANLDELPGHEPSIDALWDVMSAKGWHAQLADAMSQQAEVLEQSQPRAALGLWKRVAAHVESKLGDAERAISCYLRVFALEPEGIALDALGRLHAERGEYGAAVEWLERKLAADSEDQRAATTLRLAQAHLHTGHPERARACLEDAVRGDPGALAARELLARIYRQDESWEPLGRLLVEGFDHVPQQDKLAYARESAEIYYRKLGAAPKAITSLERAIELDREDRELHLMLADALRIDGRLDRAREVLQTLIDEFGRRRSPARAAVHFEMARVARDAGDTEAAFEQLELATRMDVGHLQAMQALGDLAHDAGDLDRAERAYRGLLLAARRRKAGEERSRIGPSEVFYQLHQIAELRGRVEQAQELLESALETAVQNDDEARRFQAFLLGRNETDPVMRVLDLRLEHVRDPLVEAEVLAVRAEVLERLGRLDEALEACMAALEKNPTSIELHDAARGLAKQAEKTQRYIDSVSALAERARRKGEARLAALLHLRLGSVIEQEVGDLDRAAGLYAKAEASGECVAEAWAALARVAGARGDVAEQRRVLREIAQLSSDVVTGKVRTDALFQLAQIELAASDTRDQGLESLKLALQRDPQYQRARAMLEHAIDRAPEHQGLLNLYERVARSSGDRQMLLEWFERRLKLESATLEDVREAFEHAMAVDAVERAERLLRRGLEHANGAPDAAEHRPWLLSGLAECRKRLGDLEGALNCLQEALLETEDDERGTLTLRLAQLASTTGGNRELALQAYRSLWSRDPANPELWQPLVRLYHELGDKEGLGECVEGTLASMPEPRQRNALRMQHVAYLMRGHEQAPATQAPGAVDVGAIDEVAPVLRQVLREQPDHGEALDLLAGLLEGAGRTDELLDLLKERFQHACGLGDAQMVVPLAQRLGALLRSGDRQAEAKALYRAALECVPQSRAILNDLRESLDCDEDALERADVMQRILAIEAPERAPALALELADFWQERGQQARRRRTLEIGQRLCPDHEELRARLVACLEEQEVWPALIELLVSEAHRVAGSDKQGAVARLRDAARLCRERLGDSAAASEHLRQALLIDAHDVSVLAELTRCLADSGDPQTAIEQLTGLLDQREQAGAVRAELLKVRADLWLALKRPDAALADLAQAQELSGEGLHDELSQAYEAQRRLAAEQGDAEIVRTATFKLASARAAAGDVEAARELLSGWVVGQPEDVEALRELRDVLFASARWADAVPICDQLVELEQGDALVSAALDLARAAEQAGAGERARQGLERAYASQPESGELRGALLQIYEQTDAKRELAKLLLADVERLDDEDEQFELLRRCGQLLQHEEPEAALAALKRAVELKPKDHATTVLVIDALTELERHDETRQLLESAIASHKRRRSAALAELLHRRARLCLLNADPAGQLKWLSQALDTDRSSGPIAAELAELAMAQGNLELAQKALRAITMMESPEPLSRAAAFLKQAEIANIQGDRRRAQHWARRARSLDPELAEAQSFLEQLDG